MTEIDDLKPTIEPNSDQLNADDMLTGPITAKITAVKPGPPDQPVIIHLEGYKPWRPCKTTRRILIALWGTDGRAWVGRRVQLYRDPDVTYGGVKMGGIRISHMSDIGRPHTLMLTMSRMKRSPVTINPMPRSLIPVYSDSDFQENLPKWRALVEAKRATWADIQKKILEAYELTEQQLREMK